MPVPLCPQQVMRMKHTSSREVHTFVCDHTRCPWYTFHPEFTRTLFENPPVSEKVGAVSLKLAHASEWSACIKRSVGLGCSSACTTRQSCAVGRVMRCVKIRRTLFVIQRDHRLDGGAHWFLFARYPVETSQSRCLSIYYTPFIAYNHHRF